MKSNESNETIEQLTFDIMGTSYTFNVNIQTIPVDTPLFHWGSIRDIDEKINKNNIYGVVDFVFKKGSSGYMNDGFYISKDIDSIHYGSNGLKLLPKEPIRIMKLYDIRDQLAKKGISISPSELPFFIGHEALERLNIKGLYGPPMPKEAWVSLTTGEFNHEVQYVDSSDIFKIPSNSLNLNKIFSFDRKCPIAVEHLEKLEGIKNLSSDVILNNLRDTFDDRKSVCLYDPTLPSGQNTDQNFTQNLKYCKTPFSDICYSKLNEHAQKLYDEPKIDDVDNVIRKIENLPTEDLSGSDIFELFTTNSDQTVYQNFLEIQAMGIPSDEHADFINYLRDDSNNFLKGLISCTQFIDRYDILEKIALQDPMPWARYDDYGRAGEQLGKWERCLETVFLKEYGNMNYKLTQRNQKDNHQSGIESIYQIYREREQLIFRGHEVIAGGGYDENGKLMLSDTSEGQGYFKATTEQYNRLKEYPFIDVINHIKLDENTCLIKYRYPDIRDIDKLREHAPKTFASIQSELENLDEENARAFQDSLNIAFPSIVAGMLDRGEILEIDQKYKNFILYTKKMVEELFENVTNNKTLSSEARYQSLLTLHPFFDTNGRVMRTYYKAETGIPFLLKNWDFDILYSEKELKYEIMKNLSEWIRIVGEWKGESFSANEHYRMPEFYSCPKFWLLSVGLDPQSFSNEQQVKIVNQLKKTFSSPEFHKLNDKKAWLDANQYVKSQLNFANLGFNCDFNDLNSSPFKVIGTRSQLIENVFKKALFDSVEKSDTVHLQDLLKAFSEKGGQVNQMRNSSNILLLDFAKMQKNNEIVQIIERFDANKENRPDPILKHQIYDKSSQNKLEKKPISHMYDKSSQNKLEKKPISHNRPRKP
jgi:hypothetical protein